MSKKNIYGKCKLCGKYTKLTYEHVPPRKAFNNHSTKKVSGDQILKHITSDEKPWDVSKLWGKIQQQGSGGYYLCKDCNENTGTWYVPSYLDFVHGVYRVVEEVDPDRKASYIKIQTSTIKPLPLFKEIMVMFCDINHNFYEDKDLRSFLLNKEQSTGFDKEKYRVFCYIKSGSLYRINGTTTYILSSKDAEPMLVHVSEISFIPLGFALYIDLPKGFQPQGCEITEWCEFSYDKETCCEITLPVLPNEIVFSGDYRNKEELEHITKSKGTLET